MRGDLVDAVGGFDLGVLLEQRGDVDGAIAAFQGADELGHSGAASSLGLLLEQRGEVDGALGAYRRADERGDAAGAFNLGGLLADSGDLAGAEAAYWRASERSDGEIADEARSALGKLHERPARALDL
jgi:tetratricopeptide (TPR) repeat protein